ncbi:MAG: hypothetical protein GXZ07_02025 [Firmicutes bacterium]|nr:hypothetical protein [Bacillota bacterium]
MKLKRLSCFVLFCFLMSIFLPSVSLASGSGGTIDKIADELWSIYPYLDETDKAALRAARENLQIFVDENRYSDVYSGGDSYDDAWDTVIGALMTDEVKAIYGSKEDARTALIEFATGVANSYYASSREDLIIRLTKFKDDYKDDFQKLFGSDIKLETLYNLLEHTRKEIPNVIKTKTDPDYLNKLAFGTNTDLINTIPKITKDAMLAALDAFPYFKGKLSAIGWSVDKIIEQRTELSQLIDPNNAAELALAKAAVRSETELVEDKTTLSIGESTTYKIQIMGKNATGLVNWHSSDPQVAEFNKLDDGRYGETLTAKSAGTTLITAYRAYNGGTPENDWIIRFPVVVNPAGTGGGGGGGGGGPSAPVTPPAESKEVVIEVLKGGKITVNGVIVEILPNALPEDTKVLVILVEDISDLPLLSSLLSDVYEITKDKAGIFTEPVKITLSFDKSKVDPNKYDIVIAWYCEKIGKWIVLDDVEVDFEAGTVCGMTDHFTKFAVLAMDKVALQLKDIKGHWAENLITRLVRLGSISGYPDGTFKPNNNITRGEFATILVETYGLTQKTGGGKTFKDTEQHWAKEYISIAASHGILKGYSDTEFGPDDKITREQMAVMIVNAAQAEQNAAATAFQDQNKVSGWAAEAVKAATKAGIIQGYPDNTFKPQNNATRAEAVTVILNSLR